MLGEFQLFFFLRWCDTFTRIILFENIPFLFKNINFRKFN
jgi:hypothetical protein